MPYLPRSRMISFKKGHPMKSSWIFAFCCTLLFSFQTARAAGPTYIENDITHSTEWSLNDSPYVISNDMTVSPGAVLTIDPGVQVRFTVWPGNLAGTGPNLMIKGALKAVAGVKAPISFVSTIPGGQWGSLNFLNCDSANSILVECKIRGGRISCTGSSPTISSCLITRSKGGIVVSDNSQPQILGNWIKGNNYGLVLTADTASPVVERNVISGNNYGIYLQAFHAPAIAHNRIFNNLKYNLVNASAKPLDVSNNDFNTADPDQVAKGIYDGADNPGMGFLNYSPFTVAASYPPAPSKPVVRARAKRFETQFSLSLDVLGMSVFSSPHPYLVPSVGVGGQAFLDWRPIPLLSFGIGGQYSYFFGAHTFNLNSCDIGGRIFPFSSGTTMEGEFYLQGGVGLNLLVLYPAPGHYHGYAGLGFREMVGTDQALDMGVQYDFYSPIGASTNVIGLKLGWTFLFNTI